MSDSDYEDDDVAAEVADEPVPDWVKEGTEDDDITVGGEDISASQPFERSDVIEPAKGVTMTIKKVVMDRYIPQGEVGWMRISMKPTLVVGPNGVDGKGRYKNKHFFPRILVAINREGFPDSFNSKFYEPRVGGAWGDYNTFLKALGFSTSPAPTNDKQFRDSLVGREIIVDINKDRKRVKDNVTGKYVYVDEYENTLSYKGSPKQQASAPDAEAAVA